MICFSCKHFGDVSWTNKKQGCKEANIRWGTDGYGPWYQSPTCKHDPDQTPLKDLFTPITEEERIKPFNRIQELEKQLENSRINVEKLERKIILLCKEETHQKEQGE